LLDRTIAFCLVAHGLQAAYLLLATGSWRDGFHASGRLSGVGRLASGFLGNRGRKSI